MSRWSWHRTGSAIVFESKEDEKGEEGKK